MEMFTSVEQSRELENILPVETADLWWAERYTGDTIDWKYVLSDTPYYYISFTKPSVDNVSIDAINDIPCWSLTALLEVLPSYDLRKYEDTECLLRCRYSGGDELVYGETPVDACVKMILKLNENCYFLKENKE